MPEDLINEMASSYPQPHHPVIRTHPETGKQGVYVSANFTESVDGVSLDEGRDILSSLYAQATVPEFQCRFKWAEGSVAFWDNRACQHYASSDYFPQPRSMERVTIAGDKPFYDAEAKPVCFDEVPSGLAQPAAAKL